MKITEYTQTSKIPKIFEFLNEKGGIFSKLVKQNLGKTLLSP